MEQDQIKAHAAAAAAHASAPPLAPFAPPAAQDDEEEGISIGEIFANIMEYPMVPPGAANEDAIGDYAQTAAEEESA